MLTSAAKVSAFFCILFASSQAAPLPMHPSSEKAYKYETYTPRLHHNRSLASVSDAGVASGSQTSRPNLAVLYSPVNGSPSTRRLLTESTSTTQQGREQEQGYYTQGSSGFDHSGRPLRRRYGQGDQFGTPLPHQFTFHPFRGMKVYTHGETSVRQQLLPTDQHSSETVHGHEEQRETLNPVQQSVQRQVRSETYTSHSERRPSDLDPGSPSESNFKRPRRRSRVSDYTTPMPQQHGEGSHHGTTSHHDLDLSSFGVDLGYAWSDDKELCWSKMGERARENIVELVSKKTCDSKENIEGKLAVHLTPLIAIALSMGDDSITSEALLMMDYESVSQAWKQNLTETEADTLVEKLQEVSDREAVEIRHFLSQNHIPSDYARTLLNMGEHQRYRFALKAGLVVQDAPTSLTPTVIQHTDDFFHDWMEGTTQEQRNQVVAIVMRVCDCSKSQAMKILSKEKVKRTDFLALRILHAELSDTLDQEIKELIQTITGTRSRVRWEYRGPAS
ncbi:hypothetical protein CBS101457_000251 [Exobasidium rhododendri]|nr:hypothetical protein CBS101457_000251 [Exobasidium rhododendri]